MKALFIASSGVCRVLNTDDTKVCELIGGWVEGIMLDSAVMYVDEEGRVKRLRRNDVASILWQKYTRRFDKPFIVGPAVIIGVNEHGEAADIPNSYLSEVGL